MCRCSLILQNLDFISNMDDVTRKTSQGVQSASGRNRKKVLQFVSQEFCWTPIVKLHHVIHFPLSHRHGGNGWKNKRMLRGGNKRALAPHQTEALWRNFLLCHVAKKTMSQWTNWAREIFDTWKQAWFKHSVTWISWSPLDSTQGVVYLESYSCHDLLLEKEICFQTESKHDSQAISWAR